MNNNLHTPERGALGDSTMNQQDELTPDSMYLLLGDIISNPTSVHKESKLTVVAFFRHVGVQTQEDLSLLMETDLPKTTQHESGDESSLYNFEDTDSIKIGAFRSIIFRKHFMQLVKYVGNGNRIRIGCTMKDVDMSIHFSSRIPMPTSPAIPFMSPGLNMTGGIPIIPSSHKIDLKLKEFARRDEDFRIFKRKTRSKLGAHGLLTYIDDSSSFIVNWPVSETVYYQLVDALSAVVASFLIDERQYENKGGI